jgi:hypothetical protein
MKREIEEHEKKRRGKRQRKRKKDRTNLDCGPWWRTLKHNLRASETPGGWVTRLCSRVAIGIASGEWWCGKKYPQVNQPGWKTCLVEERSNVVIDCRREDEQDDIDNQSKKKSKAKKKVKKSEEKLMGQQQQSPQL